MLSNVILLEAQIPQ